MSTQITQAGPPSAAELADPAVAKTWKTAQDFETMTLGQFLKPMFETVDSAHGEFGGGDGEAAWRPMLTQELAKTMAKHGGLGLAVPVFRQMLQAQESGQ
jgi:Rod binding domain-containing protein